ncbi:MAG: SRPBCC domain-containing protein [Actinomycetota bacterium]|nr:SRPBCC domain-containing protein [Actinomycetota bacterium]
MDVKADGTAVVREVLVDAQPETIFSFFTDPQKMVRWKGMNAKLDARPGGLYSVDVTQQALARGEYVEIDPPRRVVFTFGWEGAPVAPGSSTVEIDLIPEGSKTLVRLTHRGLPNDAERASHADGWEHYLSRLAIAATGGDPGPDKNLQQ